MDKTELNRQRQDQILSCIPFEPEAIRRGDLQRMLLERYPEEKAFANRGHVSQWLHALWRRHRIIEDLMGRHAQPKPHGISALSKEIRDANNAIRSKFKKNT
jgi:hypothetical protein